MKDTTKSPLTTSARRRAQHVTRACNTCRRRKSKCDGVQPVCASCSTSGHECTWSQEEDNRRPSTKAYVETLRNRNLILEARVAALEGRLLAAGLPTEESQYLTPGHHNLSLNTSMLGSPASSPSPGGFHSSTSTEYGEDDDADRIGLGLGKLVLEDNDLHHYGPTSAFINLSSATQSPISSPVRSPNDDNNEIYELRLTTPTTSPEEALADAAWSRYLPTDHLLTRQIHDQLIDRFFKFFSSWCYRSIPQCFLRDMHRALSLPSDSPLPKSAHYSPMLHNALLSVATAYADDLPIKTREHRMKFAAKAKEYIEGECQKPTLSVVQALAHLSSFHSGIAEQSVGFMYFGMSVRMAQALGLNLDTADFVRGGHISEEDRRDRIWLFWSTFAQDKCWSVYVGRDFSVPLPRTLPYPESVEVHDQAPWIWRRTFPSNIPMELLEKEMQRVPLPNKTGHAFQETTKLCLLATKIMDVVYGTNHELSMAKRREKVTEIHLQLDQWHNELPDHLCVQRPKATTNALPHVIMLNLAYNWLTILLHRPFYRTTASSPTALSPHGPGSTDLSVKRCDSAADKIVQLFSAYRRLYGLRFTPDTANQIAYTAGMTYLQCAVQFSTKPAKRKAALEGVRMCIGFLREIGQTWQCANQTAGILKGLLKEQLSPNEYSPMPSRNATVEVQPPTRAQSRSHSIDQIMEYEAMYTTPPSTLQLFTDNFTLDPEMTIVDEFDQDPEFQRLWQTLSQPSSASSPQSSTYDASSPFHAALQMSGLANAPSPLQSIQEGYLSTASRGSSGSGTAFHHSPLSLSNSPLPHPQQLPSQDPQQLYPNFHHLFRPGVGGVGMSIDGEGLPPPRSLSFDYDQTPAPANRSFNAEAFDIHAQQTFGSQPGYPLYIPESATKQPSRRTQHWAP